MTFEQEIAALINKQSRENRSNTPDFILAEFLGSCLRAFEMTVNRREDWHQARVLTKGCPGGNVPDQRGSDVGVQAGDGAEAGAGAGADAAPGSAAGAEAAAADSEKEA